MRYIAPLLVLYGLVCLTSPDGAGVWLERNQIVSIVRPVGDCAVGAQTKITLGNGSAVCVSEAIKDVVKKIDDAK